MMSAMPNPVPPPPQQQQSREFDFGRLISRAWEERVRLIGVSLAAGLLALGIGFLFPRWYEATATILPPEDSDLFSNLMLGQRALTKFPAFGALGDYFTPADVFKAILKSRHVQDRIIDRFELQKVYKQKSREKTRKALRNLYSVELAPEGTITVAIEDKDPKRAAAMAMAFLEELDHYNIKNKNSRAKRTREFLEQRVLDTDSLLRVSEERLRIYQEAKHTVVPTNIQSSEVQSAADLMARKIALEVRLGVLRTYLTEDSDEIRQTKTELNQLKNQIVTLPALQSDISRMVRDQKIQEQVFVLLTAELEQARIRETMDTPTVAVLDRAVVPERHTRPKRATIAIIATLLTGAGCLVFLAFQERRTVAR
jgi:tyrosine-protein kinase Etk/Wzc